MENFKYNEIPIIGFRNTNNKKEKVISFLSNPKKHFLNVNYSLSSNNYLFFLKDSLSEVNLVEGLDYIVTSSYGNIELTDYLNENISIEDFSFKKSNLESLLKTIVTKKIKFDSDILIVYVDKNKNDNILKIFQKLKAEQKIKIIYLANNMVNFDMNFQSNFNIEEETDIRNYIESLYEIDSDKLTRMITNYVYNEVISSKNKINTFYEYQKILNDVEENLMKSLFEKKEELIINNNNINKFSEDTDIFEDEIEENNKEKDEEIPDTKTTDTKIDEVKTEELNPVKETDKNNIMIYIIFGVLIIGLIYGYFTI